METRRHVATDEIPLGSGRTLLAIARASLARALRRPEPTWTHAPWLDKLGATFVTLTQDGELRGCIGTLSAHRPLAVDVRENALAAAFTDPRFQRLRPDELGGTCVEVSLLTEPEPLAVVRDERSAAALLRPGVDGVILTAGPHRATFLPQVWESLREPAEFLRALKAKAGMSPWGWPADARLMRYEVSKWREGEEEDSP